MNTFGSTSATSSTAMQDRVANGNSQQARRGSGDNKVFANMLAAAAENATPETGLETRERPGAKEKEAEGDAGNSPGNVLNSLVDSPRLKTADDQNVNADTQTNEEPTDHTPKSGRGTRGSVPTLSLAVREAPSSRSVQPDALDSSNQGPTGNATGVAALGPTLGDGRASDGPVGNSLAAALAAAIEDAMDVADDVTLAASTVTDTQLAASIHDGSAVEAAALTNEQNGERNLAAGTDATQAPTETWQNAWSNAMDKIGQQVSYWLGKGVSQAQLTVHGSQGDAVDVRVLLRDGQAHLEFLTNNELTRATIAQNGADALRTALGQSGISLASLSVDAQASGGHNPNGYAPQSGTTRRGLDLQDDSLERGNEVSARTVYWTSNAMLDAYA